MDWRFSWQFNFKGKIWNFPRFLFAFIWSFARKGSCRVVGVQSKFNTEKKSSYTWTYITALFLLSSELMEVKVNIWDSGFRDRPGIFIALLEAVDNQGPRPLSVLSPVQLQPMRVMLFVMRNLNREQQRGMTGMCFHWRREERKKTDEKETLRQSCVQKERSLRPERKTNVIVH